MFLGFYGYKDDENINSLGILERYESKDFVTKWGAEWRKIIYIFIIALIGKIF